MQDGLGLSQLMIISVQDFPFCGFLVAELAQWWEGRIRGHLWSKHHVTYSEWSTPDLSRVIYPADSALTSNKLEGKHKTFCSIKSMAWSLQVRTGPGQKGNTSHLHPKPGSPTTLLTFCCLPTGSAQATRSAQLSVAQTRWNVSKCNIWESIKGWKGRVQISYMSLSLS